MRYVYVLRNLINGKVYVGQTKNPAVRKAGHFYAARHGCQHPLYHSIRKHGAENFSFEVIEECNDALIDEREIHWISHFDSMNLDQGYNLTPGGDGWSVNHNVPLRKEKNRRAAITMNSKIWANDEFRQRKSLEMSVRSKQLFAQGKLKAPDWTGRQHRQETKDAIGKANSISQSGEKNSQFGTTWIYSDVEKRSQKIRKDDLQTWLDQGWLQGRKMKESNTS